MKEAKISIAEIDFSFLFDEDKVESSSGNGTNRGKEADNIIFRMHPGPLPEMNPEEIIFDSGLTWAFYRSKGKYILQDDTLDADTFPDNVIVTESDLKTGDVYTDLEPGQEMNLADPLGYPLNQVLMILLLSLGRGILLHGCGVDDGGSGYIFLGNSGHGKSTIAKLWSENQGRVLNDDRIVVREKGDQFWMYGTPWHGDMPDWSLKGLPIEKIFFLRHGEINAVTSKEGVEAVSMVLKRSFSPYWNEEGMTYTMNLCHRLVNKIPCHELNFVPDRGIMDFVRGM